MTVSEYEVGILRTALRANMLRYIDISPDEINKLLDDIHEEAVRRHQHDSRQDNIICT
jgi:CBS-domain-containing membrane protein